MTDRTITSNQASSRLSAPGVIVALFVLAMSTCVLGLVIWKALEARNAALAQSEASLRNLAHSLVEHASHNLQSADVAMSGMVDLLKYQNPKPDRFNPFLVRTARSLPQLREVGVLDEAGYWRYSSASTMPTYNNSDRDYFTYHRDHSDPAMRISAPLVSRMNGKLTIILSKRIENPDGTFHGVVAAGIDGDYFDDFYKSFSLGDNAAITLFRTDGIVLARWPSADIGKDLSNGPLFQVRLKESSTGYYKTTSPFDGLEKYVGYERSPKYQILAAVAIPEQRVLEGWRRALRADVVVAAVLLCSVILLAVLLSSQFRIRIRMEEELREREARYRLLADNVADVVILLDRLGNFVFVSHSVEFVLGLNPKKLIGRSCFELVHPEDVQAVKLASAQLTDPTAARTAVFRTFREDRSVVWVEINFKLASRAEDREKVEIVGVLRDVTRRKLMQDELTALNGRLSQLATTDGLTGLANRRTLDNFLRREYERHERISVLLIDIDNFKGYNDSMGHQAGDEVIKRVAAVVAEATESTAALSARYGGEEFAIILPNTSESDAVIVAEAVRLKVRALRIPNAASVRGYLSISVGVASRRPFTPNEAVLVGEADLALYEAKHRGRDCVVPSSALAREYFDASVPQG